MHIVHVEDRKIYAVTYPLLCAVTEGDVNRVRRRGSVDFNHCRLSQVEDMAAHCRLNEVLGAYILYTAHNSRRQLNVGAALERA